MTAGAPYPSGGDRTSRDYFEARRARVDDFVARHLSWPGTLRLHAAALGLDILRAPVNVLLSPVLVLVRSAGWICRRLHLHGPADRLGRCRILLRTAVARRIEALIAGELLDLPGGDGAAGARREALSRAVLAAPQVREVIRRRGDLAEARALAGRIMDAVGEYTGTRSAVAEFTTALCTLAVGALVFHALTPGMISMAPGVAEAVSRAAAVRDFPLGDTLGGVWYGVFPVGAPPWLVAASVAGLVLLGSVVRPSPGSSPTRCRRGPASTAAACCA